MHNMMCVALLVCLASTMMWIYIIMIDRLLATEKQHKKCIYDECLRFRFFNGVVSIAGGPLRFRCLQLPVSGSNAKFC